MRTLRVYTILAIASFGLLSLFDRASADIRVIPLAEGAIASDAEVGTDGVVHVAYFQQDDIYYVRSGDDGKTWSEPLRVNSDPETAYAGAFRGPDLAVAAGGRVHVVWYTSGYQRKLPKEEWGVHYAYLSPGVDVFSEGRNLNHKPSDNYSLAVGPGEHVAVAWTAGQLYVQLSADGGDTFSDVVQVELADPCECCATRAAFNGDNELSIFYREKKDHIRDMHLLTFGLDSDSISRTRLSSESWQIEGCPMTGAYLSRNPDGDVMAAWETKGKIRFARIASDGSVAAPGVVEASERGKYPIVLTDGGGSLVGWKDGGMLRWAGFDAAGTASGLVGSFNAGNAHRPSGVVTETSDYLLFP